MGQHRGCTPLFTALIICSALVGISFHALQVPEQSPRVRKAGLRPAPDFPVSSITPSPAPALISVLVSTQASRARFNENVLANYGRQTYENKEMIIFEDGAPLPSDFWLSLNGTSGIRLLHTSVQVGIGSKHLAMTRHARGDYMAIMDDDDLYSREYLERMHLELNARGVDLVKLGYWTLFDSRPSGDEFAGRFWLFDVSNAPEKVRLGYGFTYFFSRHAAHLEGALVKTELVHDWDSRWVLSMLSSPDFRGVAVLQNHSWDCVVKLQHGDNISGPISSLLRSHFATAKAIKRVTELMRKTLPVRIGFPPARCVTSHGIDAKVSKRHDLSRIDRVTVLSEADCKCAPSRNSYRNS